MDVQISGKTHIITKFIAIVLNPSFGKTIPRSTVHRLEQFLRRWKVIRFVSKVPMQATTETNIFYFFWDHKTNLFKTNECKKNANMLSKTI